MKLPRNLSGENLITSLIKLGYQVTRQKGSHVRLSIKLLEETHHITIPNHKSLKIGTLNNILTEIATIHKIPKNELIEKLFT